MMKRIKTIQDRVLPLINNENNHEIDPEVGWRTKMEQKVGKLETAIDAIDKQMQIKLEKHMIGLQKKMCAKYEEIKASLKA